MADTQFELNMDDFVRKNLIWRTWVQFREDGNWVTNRFDIKERLDYRVGFKVMNVGSETYAKNVQIRVVNAYSPRVTFFADDTYANQVPRSDNVFPNMLDPSQGTPWHWVYFRVGSGPDQIERIASVGVYAEIIPQGHYWSDFFAPLD